MADIRVQYLAYEEIESRVNSDLFSIDELPGILNDLKKLMISGDNIDKRFTQLNQGYFHPDELAEENRLRDIKPRLLYEQLSKQ
jgi:hypothetical protein